MNPTQVAITFRNISNLIGTGQFPTVPANQIVEAMSFLHSLANQIDKDNPQDASDQPEADTTGVGSN